MKFTVAYHSGYGHTKVIAHSVVKGAQAVISDAKAIDVATITDADWARLKESNAIVFGSPTYMGSVSGPFKVFMDASSKQWMGREWNNKVAGGFTVSGSPSGDKLGTLQALAVLAAQHGMIWVGQNELPGFYAGKSGAENVNRLGSFLGVMAQAGQESPEVSPPAEDHRTAEIYGKRIAEIAKKLAA